MSDVSVHFAGLTGPDASGGAMAIAFVVMEGDEQKAFGARFMPAHYDGTWHAASWHAASYHALAYALERCKTKLGAEPTFSTDDEMVVKQMQGRRGVKGGHYVDAREDALDLLAQAFPSRDVRYKFVWVPRHQNLAVPFCDDHFELRGLEPWSYKKAKEEREKALEHLR